MPLNRLRLLSSAILAAAAIAGPAGAGQTGLLFRLSADQGLTAEVAGGDPVPNFADKAKIVPTGVKGGGLWRSMAAGGRFTCGQRHNGYAFLVVCWGDNSLGQVGVTAGGVRLIPVEPNFVPNNEPSRLVAGYAHACVSMEFVLRCWGDNSRGQVGNGSIGGVVAPTVIPLPLPAYDRPLALGRAHTCAVGGYIPALSAYDVNAVYCWGANDHGQLGDGTTTSSAFPLLVKGIP